MAESMASGTVAPGRSVAVGGGTEWVGTKDKGRRISIPRRFVGPGERVTLPAAEIGELMAHGFLLTPKGDRRPLPSDGPSTLQDGANAPKVPIEA